MDNKKKITAAIAGVMSYIQTEEEAICAASMMAAPAIAAPQRPEAPLKLWGISGRQMQMQMRNLMQLKALR